MITANEVRAITEVYKREDICSLKETATAIVEELKPMILREAVKGHHILIVDVEQAYPENLRVAILHTLLELGFNTVFNQGSNYICLEW